MSWDEQKWTVDQIGSNVQTKLNTLRTNVKNDVNTTITSNDSGKDNYVCGVRRGLVKKTISVHSGNVGSNSVEKELLNITGNGWVTSISARNTSGSVYQLGIIVVIDGTQTIRVSATTSLSSASLTVNPDALTSSYLSTSDFNVVNSAMVQNTPIKFNNHLVVKGYCSTSSTSNIIYGNLEYILQ